MRRLGIGWFGLLGITREYEMRDQILVATLGDNVKDGKVHFLDASTYPTLLLGCNWFFAHERVKHQYLRARAYSKSVLMIQYQI